MESVSKESPMHRGAPRRMKIVSFSRENKAGGELRVWVPKLYLMCP
ncbi:hypothetical protein [Candidatus Hakubella thermalkaliphila]|nr:hypothetical protein [Candidatus Hakubella thermalkaliphila]